MLDTRYENDHIGPQQMQLNINFSVISVKSDPINDKSIIVQKGLNKKNNVDFIHYERKTFYKNVPNAKNFLFDLGMDSIMERPKYIIIGFENKKMLMNKLMMPVHMI